MEATGHIKGKMTNAWREIIDSISTLSKLNFEAETKGKMTTHGRTEEESSN